MSPSDEELESGEPESGEEEGVPICPFCLARLESDEALFCDRCGAPVDSVAAIMPFERIEAQGYLFREAVSRPRNWLVLVGIWVLLVPQVIVITVLLAWPGDAKASGSSSPGWDERGMQALLAFYALVLAIIVARVTVAFFRRGRTRGKVSDRDGLS